MLGIHSVHFHFQPSKRFLHFGKILGEVPVPRIEYKVAVSIVLQDAGAITAALFLNRFVTGTKAWMHLGYRGMDRSSQTRPPGRRA